MIRARSMRDAAGDKRSTEIEREPARAVKQRRAAGLKSGDSSTPRMPKLPYITSRLLVAAAALMLAQVVLPNVAWLGALVDLFSTLLIPVDSGSPGIAIFLLILGAALARRQRAAWMITVLMLAFLVLSDLSIVIVLIVLAGPGQIDVSDLPALARFGFNLATVGSLLACLLYYRREFAARRSRGDVRRALLTLLAGLLLTFALGMALVTAFPSGLTTPRGRIAWLVERMAFGLVGADDIGASTLAGPTGWINTVVGLCAGLSLIAALVGLVRSQQVAALVSAEDEPRIRALVAESAEDSLAYFATRRDKSVVFSPSGRAAVLYRVDLGVCLASSDPIGPPDHWPAAIRAWLELTETHGWTPAVLGASEAGATAYARAGMRVLRLGDEAILETKEFALDRREMRPVRQAVQRLERMGYSVRVRRHRDIPPDEMEALIARIAAWRDTETERGFSMALGRLGDPSDGDCLMVEALFPAGRPSAEPQPEVAAILSFVPWGTDGFSLDVMRRSPLADNGVNELMVAGLMAAGRDLRIRRVSLNFAVFRSAFEEGARIGAGPVLRLWRRLLLVASRWWQIESLFRSNVKYRPDWQPRFLCFAETRDIALVGAASGVVEGFIDLPPLLRGKRSDDAARPLPPRPAAAAAAIPLGGTSATQALTADGTRATLPEQVRLRRDVRDRLLASGIDPYPTGWRPSRRCAELRLGAQVSVAGRALNVRDFGGVIFVRVRDWTGDAQLMLTRSTTGAAAMAEFRRTIDLGDHVGAEGLMVLSRTGDQVLEVTRWILTAKALRPLPDKHRGIADPETRVRQRYLDLALNADARRHLATRSLAIAAVRDTLRSRGFLEVETPILQTIHGGANARPFRTHSNAYDLSLYLRIAPELYLKRLMVGGMDRIFEIGRNFRNEGADATHNPEFTMLEAYQAYGDYATMRTVTQDLIRQAAQAARGHLLITGRDHTGVVHEVDLAEPWRVITVNDAISAAAEADVTADTDRETLLALAGRLGIACDPRWTRGAVLLELYEHLCERTTVQPTFYTDFPAEVSPLTREHRHDPRLAERWDLVAFGAEIATAYSELVDPVIQRERLTTQSLQAAGGDPEAMELDEDFLTALEYGMPPSGGLGMGLDRLVMMLTDASIRETIAFPLVRPRGGGR